MQKYRDIGDFDNALASAKEAVELREVALEKYGSDRNRAELASTRSLYANALCDKGEHTQALQEVKKAVDSIREVAGRANIFNEQLAIVLVNYGRVLEPVGALDEAVDVTKEGADIFRDLFQGAPDVYAQDYAICLHDLAKLTVMADRYEAALPVFTEAVPAWYSLWQKYGGIHVENLFYALLGKYTVLSKLGRTSEMPDNEIILYVILQESAYAELSVVFNYCLWAVYLDHFWASILEEYNGFQHLVT